MSKVLIGCEESGVMTSAFRKRGHEAYSCDLQPTRGNPAWHIQGDVMEVIETEQWGLIVLHPDCTAMALSGNRWYGKGMPRHKERLSAINWTVALWELAKRYAPRVALENPKSVIFPVLRKLGARVQFIQPHQFGHGEVKSTGFALHSHSRLYPLDELVPTNEVDGREERVWRMAPGPNRKRDRSETYQGIADACAEQWG